MDVKTPQRRATRLRGYDYSQAGAYFVTFCTNGRRNLLGEIRDGAAMLNEYGNVVETDVGLLGSRWPGLVVDCHVVMPNHVHLLLFLAPRPLNDVAVKDRNPSVSRIVGGQKTFSAVRINALRNVTGPFWQRGFHDHIVRLENNHDLERIREYVTNNPLAWECDKENRRRTAISPFYSWLDSREPGSGG